VLGVVDRARILESIAGREDPDGPGGAGGPGTVQHHDPPPKVEPVNEPTQETAEFLVEHLHDPEAGT
jgi:hypothetical protein